MYFIEENWQVKPFIYLTNILSAGAFGIEKVMASADTVLICIDMEIY